MGNFEKLSVLVIVVIILMILVVALYTWTDNPDGSPGVSEKSVATAEDAKTFSTVVSGPVLPKPGPIKFPIVNPVDRLAPAPPGPSIVPFPLPEPLPAPAPAPEPKVAPEAKTHVVAPGETFGKIAAKYFSGRVQKGTDAIMKANPTVEPTRMRQGITLVIPDLGAEPARSDGKAPILPAKSERPEGSSGVTKGSTYVVRKGDSLPVLSKRAYGDTARWQDIWLENFNAIDDPDHLLPGTRLKIPR